MDTDAKLKGVNTEDIGSTQTTSSKSETVDMQQMLQMGRLYVPNTTFKRLIGTGARGIILKSRIQDPDARVNIKLEG